MSEILKENCSKYRRACEELNDKKYCRHHSHKSLYLQPYYSLRYSTHVLLAVGMHIDGIYGIVLFYIEMKMDASDNALIAS